MEGGCMYAVRRGYLAVARAVAGSHVTNGVASSTVYLLHARHGKGQPGCTDSQTWRHAWDWRHFGGKVRYLVLGTCD